MGVVAVAVQFHHPVYEILDGAALACDSAEIAQVLLADCDVLSSC